MMEPAIHAVLDGLASDTVLISIAAGLSLETLADYAGEKTKIVRVMPNTPAMVGEGMASISSNGNVTAEETAGAVDIFFQFWQSRSCR